MRLAKSKTSANKVAVFFSILPRKDKFNTVKLVYSGHLWFLKSVHYNQVSTI